MFQYKKRIHNFITEFYHLHSSNSNLWLRMKYCRYNKFPATIKFSYCFVLFHIITVTLFYTKRFSLVEKDAAALSQNVITNTIADNNSNKSLVIIMGDLRGGEETWKTLYENVLDPNSADLALIVGEPTTDDQYVNSTLYARSKYLWFFPEYDDWADAVDLINGPDWRETHLPKMKRFQSTGIFGGIKAKKESEHGRETRGTNGNQLDLRFASLDSSIPDEQTSI